MDDLQYIELIQALLNTCYISSRAMMRLATKLVGEETLTDYPVLNEWISGLYPVDSDDTVPDIPIPTPI